jgi:hypothetical protein
MIAPLDFSNPLAMAAELSPDELACLAGIDDLDNLLQFMSAPESATPEKQQDLINCLDDETVLRLLLTEIMLAATGPLSVETSACIRVGMEGIDVRSVMLAGIGGDEEAAMIGGMAAMFTTMSCLNEEEFAAAGPELGMTQEDLESFACVTNELGGPENLAAVFSSEDEAAFMTLLGAAFACGMEMEVPAG